MENRLRKGAGMNQRYGWMIDPVDSHYMVHEPGQQEMLDKVAAYRKHGIASWRNIADLLSTKVERTISRYSARDILVRERPEVFEDGVL